MKPLVVPGQLDSLTEIGDYVLDAAQQAGLTARSTYGLRLAVDEIASNIVLHGYQAANMHGSIRISATIEPRTLTVVLEDKALPFDPRLFPPPDNLDAPLEERNIGGLGLYLALQSVDQFRYESVGSRNRNVFIVYRTPLAADNAAQPRTNG